MMRETRNATFSNRDFGQEEAGEARARRLRMEEAAAAAERRGWGAQKVQEAPPAPPPQTRVAPSYEPEPVPVAPGSAQRIAPAHQPPSPDLAALPDAVLDSLPWPGKPQNRPPAWMLEEDPPQTVEPKQPAAASAYEQEWNTLRPKVQNPWHSMDEEERKMMVSDHEELQGPSLVSMEVNEPPLKLPSEVLTDKMESQATKTVVLPDTSPRLPVAIPQDTQDKHNQGSEEDRPANDQTITNFVETDQSKQARPSNLYDAEPAEISSSSISSSASSLSKKQLEEVTIANENATLIIKSLDPNGRPITSDDVKATDMGTDMFGFGTGWNPASRHGKLKRQYPGKSDDEIALAETARRNTVRAQVLLAEHGLLDKKEITKLQLRGMGVILESTIDMGLALAPYSRLVQALKPAHHLATQVGRGVLPKSVVTEANMIFNSGKIKLLADAHKAGKSITVTINGRPIQVVPGGPFSGFTNARTGGFALGDDAFTSLDELRATIIHEIHRLRNSTIMSSGVSAEKAAAETAAAAAAALKATGR